MCTSCSYCAKPYATPSNCRRHEHHFCILAKQEAAKAVEAAKAAEPVEAAGPSDPAVGRVKCPDCYKTFTSQIGLRIHERKGCEKVQSPLECKYCNKTFNTRSAKCRHVAKCACDHEIRTKPVTLAKLDYEVFSITTSFKQYYSIVDMAGPLHGVVRNYARYALSHPEYRIVAIPSKHSRTCALLVPSKKSVIAAGGPEAKWEIRNKKEVMTTITNRLIAGMLNCFTALKSIMGSDHAKRFRDHREPYLSMVLDEQDEAHIGGNTQGKLLKMTPKERRGTFKRMMIEATNEFVKTTQKVYGKRRINTLPLPQNVTLLC